MLHFLLPTPSPPETPLSQLASVSQACHPSHLFSLLRALKYFHNFSYLKKKKIPPPSTAHSPTTSLHLNIEIHLFLLSLPPTIWFSSYNLVGNIHAPLKEQTVLKVIKNFFCQTPQILDVPLGSDTLGCGFQLLQSRLTPCGCLVLSHISAYVSASSEDCHDD